jgi:DNA primase catalytic core
MSFNKIKNLEDQLAKIKMFLPVYLEEQLKTDFSGGKKICCLSPDHNDRSPSMSMFRVKDSNLPLLKCHSCGIVMDIFNACHVLEHRPLLGPGFIDDTVMYLSKKYDVDIEICKMSEDELYEMNIVNMNKNIHNYIVHQEFDAQHLVELNKRGWTPEFANKLGIGVCHDVNHMKQYLKSIGYSFKFMDENDLDHSRVFNSSSLIFTIFDEYARPVAFAARNLNFDGLKDEAGRFINGTKFINTKVNPRCGIGKKNEMLYLFHIARTKIAPIYVFEGNADAVTAHNAGIYNSVAICGLGLNENHLNMFRRHGIYDIVVCLDNDDAGMIKAKQILDDALKKVHDIKIRFVFLPDRKVEVDGVMQTIKVDPDEFIRISGAEAFMRLPKVDPFAWRLQQFDFDQDADSESICLSMIPIIASDPSSIKREGMIRELSEYTGMPDKAIREEVSKIINADDIKIEKAKKSIVDEVVSQLAGGQVAGIESVLASALDRIQTVEKEFKTGTFDINNRVTNLLGIKQYQETEDSHTRYNFGDEFRIFNNALSGDLKQKLILLGGTANTGACDTNLNMLHS